MELFKLDGLKILSILEIISSAFESAVFVYGKAKKVDLSLDKAYRKFSVFNEARCKKSFAQKEKVIVLKILDESELSETIIPE